MEVQKFWTKTKIIILCSFLLIIGIVIAIIFINKSRQKDEYIKLEKSINTSVVANHLALEDIKLEDGEYKQIDIKDLYESKAMSGKYNDACIGYVIAEKENNQLYSKTYIKCGSVYTTPNYGAKSTKTENKDEGQTKNDTKAPEIKLLGDEKITVGLNEKYTDKGAVATDNVDGDITKKIKVTNKVDTSKEGTYIVTYTVSDKAGNKTTKERTVIVKEGAGTSTKDTTKPVITFKNLDTHQTVCIGEKIDVSKDGVYGYSAYDDVDKDITNNVKIEGNDTSTAGSHELKYSVTDKAGNKTEVTRGFTVKDCSTPAPTPQPDPTPTPQPDPTPTPQPDPTPTPQPDPTPQTVNPTGIYVPATSITLSVGQVKNVSASVEPGNATNKTLTYSSSSPSVATVDSYGNVSPKSQGTTIIIIKTSNNITKTVTIIVK
ncbi:MAG: DUF5011 domain-containing protein [Bacilli bacterium]|nr:DUF5011 domain-containing protein [Bacilli bacterium]